MLSIDSVDFSTETAIPIELSIDDAGIFDTIDATSTQVIEVAFSNASQRHFVRPWLKLAVLGLADPAHERTAVVLARSTKKNETIAVDRFRLAGDTSAEREASARRILTFALGVHQRALCSALPLFERASWADPTRPTNVNDGLKIDLSNSSASALFAGSSFTSLTDSRDIANALHPIDTGFAETGTRFQAYSRALQNCFAETTVKS
jgi:hypothetical protein